MIDTIIENSIPWDRAQTEKRLNRLDDSLVNLRRVLYQVTPDHIHLPAGGLPFPLHLLGRISDRLYPLFDDMYRLDLEAFIRREGLPGHIEGDLSYEPPKDCRIPPRKLLRFKEVDFSYPVNTFQYSRKFGYINATRIEGSRSIYHVFIPHVYRSDYLVYGEGQRLINTFLDARVLDPSR